MPRSSWWISEEDVAFRRGSRTAESDSREYFGAEGYRAPENTILAAYPTAQTRTATFDDDRNAATSEIPRLNSRGVSVDPSLIKSCAGGECG